MAAMSVAENAPATVERTPRSAQQQLAMGSFAGALYVLIGAWLVLAGIPLFWDEVLRVQDNVNEFLSATLLLMVCTVAALAVAWGGYQLIRNQHTVGLRAGIFFAAVMIFVSLWIAEAIGNVAGAQDDSTVGMVISGIIALVLLAGTVFLFLQPAWGQLLETVDEQGWFHGGAFKGNQGTRVRRGTVIGVLTLGICGIITLVMHRSFGAPARDGSNDWIWLIPGTAGAYGLPIVFKVHLILPALMFIALLYFAWRLVNVPVFADFLIATEAEMNKVSWTTRRRLIQDTIVVLVTVLLLTMFLFVVDIMWIWILGDPLGIHVGVLQIDPRKQQQQQQEKNQW